jgi:hypothetical protein
MVDEKNISFNKREFFFSIKARRMKEKSLI